MDETRNERPDDAAPLTEDQRLLARPTREQMAFIDSDPWRVLRIQGEFVEGFDRLAGMGPAVTLFGSARSGLIVITGGGFGTLDELFKSITLVQTGKISHFPIILFGTEYWGGLLDWVRDTMLTAGNISAEDLELITLSDSPEEVRDIIVDAISDGTKLDEREAAVRRATREAYRRRQRGVACTRVGRGRPARKLRRRLTATILLETNRVDAKRIYVETVEVPHDVRHEQLPGITRWILLSVPSAVPAASGQRSFHEHPMRPDVGRSRFCLGWSRRCCFQMSTR